MTGSESNFSLLWDDYQGNVSKAFHELREDNDFCDVTLACEDNQQTKAHRVVLSSCSSLFSSILRRIRHPHPLVYLWGVKLWQLEAVLDFCYRGQVMISQGELEDFIRVATLLGVKGVDSVQGEEERGQHVDVPMPLPGKDPDLESIDIKEVIPSGLIKKSKSTNREIFSIDQKEEVRPKSLIYNFFTIDPSNETIAKCIKCGKKRQREKLIFKGTVKFSNRGLPSHLRLHKEEYDLWQASQRSLVLEKRKQNIFGKKKEIHAQPEPSISDTTLLRSISNKSPSMVFESIKKESASPLKNKSIEKNDFALKLERKMENIKNMKSSHEKYKHKNKENQTLKFPCDFSNCGYLTTNAWNLMMHKKARHEKRSVPLLCSRNFCTKTFDTWQNLQEHIQTCFLKCSWSQCGKEFKRGERYKCHERVHPHGKENDFEIIEPKLPSIQLNHEDMEMKLKGIWNQIKHKDDSN